ncbi:Zn-dependent hydrolase [Desulfuromonas acetoxidans]|uniref:Amidase, hydantoinase/carbamoylase n=1 Tax=Desulfuromonas acetoxidans (strain DSM 684 / 11070) TaxID=281689 RepID=Q1K1T0_DESA6|nr:Zn-dependent hydrolase [Desulfuromonas acetoxidans]EAT16308.1 Amidase, hydantoinase/carbamoylase [Desulfuromonas acetoxidans DSM 684]MBF0644885.1 Zn-dependent hydrolase [Desulfuromonas acetoxidans]NVD25402.1 Zn-dependent hydrolase [Desulfuromonas acetoxidans]NVE17497.1 Zn-dependent hydrolase [Desulfuromonas acetoxidans]
MIDTKRFQKDFRAIAQFGALDNGGVTRLALSKADHEARNYLIKQMQQADLDVHIDPYGNIRGRRNGSDSQLPAVMVGSHLDTVPQGGHYDGIIGVLAALELVRHLNDEHITTKHPIEIIDFCCEESSRFGVATLGSKGLTGQLNCARMKELCDRDGISFYQALLQSGCSPDVENGGYLTPGDLKAFFELHIEQGPVLEHHQEHLGIVEAIAAPSRFRLTINGRSDHSGTTPMTMRQDALVAAAQLVLGTENIARQSSEQSVATIGEIHTQPNVMNVIPGSVTLGVDIRDIDGDRKQQMVAAFQNLVDTVESQSGCRIHTERLCDDAPVQLDGMLQQQLIDLAQAHQWRWRKMPSGAGHDAMHMARLAPTALIFIPSHNGISHNVAESSSLEDIMRGVTLLSEAVQQSAQE